MDVRRELARISRLDRPWQLLTSRRTLAEAVCHGVSLSGATLDLTVAVAVVDDRRPDGPAPEGLAAGRSWHATLQLLAATAAAARPVPVDEGLVRCLHWLSHRHVPAAEPGCLRPAADLALAPPPAGADAIDAAVWTAAALRRADPCPVGSSLVAHAVELLLLARAGGLDPWYAGRPSPGGDPREVLHATATAHLLRCQEGEQRWFGVARLLADAGLPDRLAGPCWDAASGLTLVNASYRSAAAVVRRRPVSEQQASRDLRALVEAGLLQPAGRTRDRSYRWSA